MGSPSRSVKYPNPSLTPQNHGPIQGKAGELTRHDMTMAPSARPPSRISSHPISCFPSLIRNWLMRPMNQLCSSYSSSRPLSWIRCWQWGHRCHLLLGHCRQQSDALHTLTGGGRAGVSRRGGRAPSLSCRAPHTDCQQLCQGSLATERVAGEVGAPCSRWHSKVQQHTCAACVHVLVLQQVAQYPLLVPLRMQQLGSHVPT